MEQQICPSCGQPMKWIAPGVSQKTGRSYSGFWSCPNRCPKVNQGYQKPSLGSQVAQAGIRQDKNDDIRANVALKMASEIIASGKAELKDWKQLADSFYNYKPGNSTTQPLPQSQDMSVMMPYINAGHVEDNAPALDEIPF